MQACQYRIAFHQGDRGVDREMGTVWHRSLRLEGPI